jgi:hypothetical protein
VCLFFVKRPHYSSTAMTLSLSLLALSHERV